MKRPPPGNAVSIRVRGQVQGVGFRPYIWKLAQEFAVRGRVLNDPEGVLIEAAGDTVTDFIAAIPLKAPKLARIDSVEVTAFAGELPENFEIAASRGAGTETRVTPDAATCADCAAEVRGNGRRRRYAFTNCTHCGPRFSILNGMPYDRARTTMANFKMCDECRAEYENPTDRRFHAQPIACPACGPRLWLETNEGEVTGDPIRQAVLRLSAGEIIAVKGLGGFHLACDASNAEAIQKLRTRKNRPAKPLALMGTEPMLEGIAILSDRDIALLRDVAAPIVLVPSRGTLPGAIAPGMSQLGVMLPYTPLHLMLIDAFGGVLVMTSGNLSGEPQVIHNDEARQKLSIFADAFLMHDRDIARRLDDSVERATPPMVLRRARGSVPGTVALPSGFEDAPQVLALGGQMKSAICLVKDGKALLGHHLGDLDDALCTEEFGKAVKDYTALFEHQPEMVAVDAHPGYRATIMGRGMDLPVREVYHHHAHLAACLADNGWPREGGVVAGIILDGTGLGPNNEVWGGELLLGDYGRFERRFRLKPAALIGGDKAAREPWRNAVARLDAAELSDWADQLFAGKPLALARQVAVKAINSPLSSSAGRLFDAAAACLGLCADAQSYEGEAAMRLEAISSLAIEQCVRFDLNGGELDPAPLFHELRRKVEVGSIPEAAVLFHASLAAAFADSARSLVESGEARAVALSGGCFQNVVLLQQVLRRLEGVPVLMHRNVPCNDGGLAFGQAMVAAACFCEAAEST